MFQRWVGISPKRFLQFLSKEYAKEALLRSRNLIEATDESALSSPGRLYDLMVRCDAMTPGEIRSGGAALEIRHGRHPTPFGECLIALTDRGICRLEFLPSNAKSGDAARLLKSWETTWPRARFRSAPKETREIVERIFSPAAVRPVPLSVLLTGTNFQIQVWEALLRIRSGMVLSYEDVAQQMGRPEAVRAVAGAIAKNRLAFVIPCHRVIRKMGVTHQYYYGALRKKAMLSWEASQKEMRNSSTFSDE